MGSLIHDKLSDARAPELVKQASRVLACMWAADGVPEASGVRKRKSRGVSSDVFLWLSDALLVSAGWEAQDESSRRALFQGLLQCV